jgi:hypothetical protein
MLIAWTTENTSFLYFCAIVAFVSVVGAHCRCIKLLPSKWKLIYDRQSVGQSVLVSGAHLGPVANFSFSLKFPSDSCVFVIL